MKYLIVFAKAAEKELEKIPKKSYIKIRKKINSLTDNPRPPGCKKLKARQNDYRIRVGDYRIIYSIEDNILIIRIIKIGHRKDIYRDL